MIFSRRKKTIIFKRKTVTISSVENSIYLEASFPLSNSFTLRFFDEKLIKKLWNDTQLFLEKIREKIDEADIVFLDRKTILILRKDNKKILSDIIRIISDVYTKDNELIHFKIGEFKEEQFEQLEILKIREEICEGIIKKLPSQNLI